MNLTAKLRTILAVMAISLCLLPTAKGATLITATVTITNVPGVGTNWIVNGNSRTWTNSSGSPPQSWITTGASVGATATNLYTHITRYAYTSPQLLVSMPSTNVIVLRGTALSITTNNYFSIAWTTNTGARLDSVQVPFENMDYATNRTNHAHWLIDALNRYPGTNWFLSNSVAMGQFLTKGASTQQVVIPPVQFNGTLRAAGSLMATGGFVHSITGISVVTTGLVNYGSAIRSEGPGGNSLQLGSNAWALGTRNVAIGNGALATNVDAIAVGTEAVATNDYSVAVGVSAQVLGGYGIAVGKSSSAGPSSIAIGANAVAATTGDSAVAVGNSTSATGTGSIGIGSEDTLASGYFSTVIGPAAQATAAHSIAIGPGATATHSNSGAYGPPDHTGTAVATTDTNQLRHGTVYHRVSIPGQLLVSGTQSNTTFTGTNIAGGSWSYPAFALSTLSAGNNIAVPFGTNRFIRAGVGPASAATICGIVGAATSGGNSGQDILLFNDTGYGLTLAVNTVDPTPGNRINTASGADVVIQDQGFATLVYDMTDGRWKVSSTYPLTATATNAVATSGASVTNLSVYNLTNYGSITFVTNAITEGNIAWGGKVATNSISFTNGLRQVIQMTNDVLFLQATNLDAMAGGDQRDIEVEIQPQHFHIATNRSIVLNGSWRRFSGAVTNALGSNKIGIIKLRRRTSTESGVAVSFEPEL